MCVRPRAGVGWWVIIFCVCSWLLLLPWNHRLLWPESKISLRIQPIAWRIQDTDCRLWVLRHKSTCVCDARSFAVSLRRSGAAAFLGSPQGQAEPSPAKTSQAQKLKVLASTIVSIPPTFPRRRRIASSTYAAPVHGHAR